jgi:hypothetical protein
LERRNEALSQINAENETQKVAWIESAAERAQPNESLGSQGSSGESTGHRRFFDA